MPTIKQLLSSARKIDERITNASRPVANGKRKTSNPKKSAGETGSGQAASAQKQQSAGETGSGQAASAQKQQSAGE